MKQTSRSNLLEHDRGRSTVVAGGLPGSGVMQLPSGAALGRRSGRRRAQKPQHVVAAYLPGQPRPLSELLNNQPPRPAAAPSPAPPAAPAAPPQHTPAAAPAPTPSQQSPPAAAAAAAAANAGGLRPPLPPAAGAVSRMARQSGRHSGSSHPPHQGLGGGVASPSSPAVTPRGGYYQIATGPGGAPLPLSMGFGAPTPDGWVSSNGVAGAAAAAAAAPYKTAAEPFEAFEPGDTGFTAPTTSEVVTSSSGSVMVKFSAHFSGVPGDKVLVCGGCRALGNWEPDAAPSLTWGEGDVWTATLEVPPGTHEYKCVAVKADPKAPLSWEPGNNRRAVVSRPAGMASSSGDEIDLVLGLLSDDEDDHPEAQLVETAGGTTMVKLTTTYTAAFGEYLKVVGGPPELGAWDAGAAPALTWGEGDVWTATLELPAGEHEFKYVVVRQDGRLEWEPGENRCIHVPPPGLAAALAAAKQAVAAEEASGGNGKRPLSPPGRRLTPAEIYAAQEAEEQLEPWQLVERDNAEKHAAASQEARVQYQRVASDAHQQQRKLQQQRLAALAGSNGSSAPAAAAAAAAGGSAAKPAAAKPKAAADWREVKFSTKFKAEFGTFLKAVGGPEQLGAWEVDDAPPLQWTEGDVWSITLLIPPGRHEFKLVVVHPDDKTVWETGPNRVVEVEPAANRDSEAAGVLLAECTYGVTEATQSIWASVDDEEPAAAAAVTPALPSQIHQAVPESWYSEQQRANAAAAAAEAEQQRLQEEQQQQQQQQQEQEQQKAPAKPLQPLDAVVKVFKERFTPWSSPTASPTASREDEAAEPAAAAADEDQQQQQQQEEEQPESPGERWAAILAGRKQPDQPAVLFMDQQQQQQPEEEQEEPEQQQEQQQEQQRQQQPWERDQSPTASASDSSSSSSRLTMDIPESRAWRPQQQHQEEGEATSERFASQIQRIRSRSNSPEPPQQEQQQQRVREPVQPSAADQPQQQQQQQPADNGDRWASIIAGRKHQQQEPRGREQPVAAELQQQQQREDDAASERFASQIQRIRSREPSPEPPQQRQQQQQPPPQQQQQQQPAADSGDRWASIIATRKQQQQEQPAVLFVDQQQQQQQEQQRRPEQQQQQQQREQPSARQQQQAPRRSGSYRTNWRTASPAPAANVGAPAPSSSSSSSSSGDAGRPRRSGSYRTNWRTASPAPAADVGAPAPQQQQQQSSPAAASWRSGGSSSGSEYSSPSSSWDSSDESPPAAAAADTRRSSWRSPSPTGDTTAAAADTAATPSSSSSSGSRFSKFTSGSSWRSSSPTSDTQQQQQQQQPAAADNGVTLGATQQQQQQRFQSSWDANDTTGKGGDYLYQLGQSDYNTNVDAGQNSSMIDSLFAGNVLGHKSDIADGSLRGWEFRTYNNIVGDYYIAPSFMDKVTMHITKNYLCDQGAIGPQVKVPLVLGIWGPKGCGKTFQTELAFKKLGVEAVVMSAGELESDVAGQPGRLIRERYRKAAEMSKVRGKLTCLIINDLDAGIGRFGNTQVTVNNQIVIGTLMNICDDPNHVSIGAGWREGDHIRRVPIIVTGNDFSTLYAPLIRDGRMEKFYWQPDTADIVNIVHQLYKEDGLSRQDIETLVATFGNQALDFFGALRSSTYDSQIRDWMHSVAGGPLDEAQEARVKEMNRRLLSQQDLPEFEPVPLTLAMLVAEGMRLVQEQQMVNNSKLGEEYMKGVAWGDVDTGTAWSSSEEAGGGGIGLLG